MFFDDVFSLSSVPPLYFCIESVFYLIHFLEILALAGLLNFCYTFICQKDNQVIHQTKEES